MTHVLDAFRAYTKSEPTANQQFSRRWSDRPWSPRQVERLAKHEASVGHLARSEELKALAAEMRTEARS
jgi:hypothetical protein